MLREDADRVRSQGRFKNIAFIEKIGLYPR